MPSEQRRIYLEPGDDQDEIEKGWHPDFEDRRTELVFIGQDMDEAAISAGLDASLSNDEELGGDLWKH